MNRHTYLRVFWDHQSPEDPVDMWSELDGDRFETRSLEYFRDGTVGYASETEQVRGTRLGELPVPPLEEIAAQAEFRPEVVSQAEFEDRWRNRMQGP